MTCKKQLRLRSMATIPTKPDLLMALIQGPNNCLRSPLHGNFRPHMCSRNYKPLL